jgi:hypothetical protein
MEDDINFLKLENKLNFFLFGTLHFNLGKVPACPELGTAQPQLVLFLSFSLFGLLFSRKGLSYVSKILQGVLSQKQN